MCAGLLATVGFLVYVVVIGGCLVLLWSSLYLWSARIGYSCYHMFVLSFAKTINKGIQARGGTALFTAKREVRAAHDYVFNINGMSVEVSSFTDV